MNSHRLHPAGQHRGIGMTSQAARDRLVTRLRSKGISSQAVLQAIAATPRHLFVDEALASRAYEDTALPIGLSQTISQPFIVAYMTQLLLNGQARLDKVLEVGTGSGYQAAVLAMVCDRVFSLERIEALLRVARRRFHQLGIHNIFTRYTDGQQGWPAQAPFDGIILTAACPVIPKELLQQLGEGARLIAPLNASGIQAMGLDKLAANNPMVNKAGARGQYLVSYTRNGDEFEPEILDTVSFVPLLDGLA